ncbi:hypothetical protein HJC23_008692 [Cyclotella cryptica]|uniref:non-specific serine/threonine protein kinase n=1 Tax=Cyclotella cryptica TaxID=29204 RepID=A0ABD3QGN2_9STRA
MDCNTALELKESEESAVVDHSETFVKSTESSTDLDSSVTRHFSDIPRDFGSEQTRKQGRQSDEESVTNCSNCDSLQSRSFPKQAGNAWRVSSCSTHHSNTCNTRTGPEANSCIIPSEPPSISLAAIMAEQKFESEERQASNIKKNRVKFCEENEEERMMRLAIEASLRDQQHHHDNFHVHSNSRKKTDSMSNNSFVCTNASRVGENHVDDDHFDEDMKIAIALSLQETDGGHVESLSQADENKKLSAEKPSAFIGDENVFENAFATTNSEPIRNVAAFASAPAPASDIEAYKDESEMLAHTLHIAEVAQAAAEAASFQFAMMLQKEEDDRQLNKLAQKQYSEAARARREEMCHGGGRGGGGGDTGVRTVGKEQFHKMKNAGNVSFDERLRQRRKVEEEGMGKLLRSGKQFNDDTMTDLRPNTAENQEMEDTYFNQVEDEDISMKFPSWQDSRSHDRSSSSFERLNYTCGHEEEAYIIGSTSVSDSAFNSFLRSEARQSGMKKGVAKQGHGRAENMNTGRTRGGAMDGAVRLQIAAAINQGLINKCNGVVKEGKEALVYHAEAGLRVSLRIDLERGPPNMFSDLGEAGSGGYDVAIKVFKRISEFKGRGAYVDGDPRFHRQKFKTNDQREQVVMWAEKEYRNLIRAHRGGVPVPLPLKQKENVLFMRFLGDNGWPSPQLKEVEMKKGSDKWTALYCQTIAAIRR